MTNFLTSFSRNFQFEVAIHSIAARRRRRRHGMCERRPSRRECGARVATAVAPARKREDTEDVPLLVLF
jgi:hypothetical protein